MRLSIVLILALGSAVCGLAAEENAIENGQLKLTYSASATTVAPGHKATLVIDIDPKPKVHLYAQGAKGYMAVDWQMEESKAWTSLPAVYPPSHMVNLPAINETVPVFSEHIHLVREITLGPDADLAGALGADRTLAVAGSLQYQACDDRLCYFPKTIPIKWTFKVGQPDTPQKAQSKTR